MRRCHYRHFAWRRDAQSHLLSVLHITNNTSVHKRHHSQRLYPKVAGLSSCDVQSGDALLQIPSAWSTGLPLTSTIRSSSYTPAAIFWHGPVSRAKPSTRIATGERQFSHFALHVWNHLPGTYWCHICWQSELMSLNGIRIRDLPPTPRYIERDKNYKYLHPFPSVGTGVRCHFYAHPVSVPSPPIPTELPFHSHPSLKMSFYLNSVLTYTADCWKNTSSTSEVMT